MANALKLYQIMPMFSPPWVFNVKKLIALRGPCKMIHKMKTPKKAWRTWRALREIKKANRPSWAMQNEPQDENSSKKLCVHGELCERSKKMISPYSSNTQ
jgi:hypothetical protein